MSRRIVILALVACYCLAGCGQKGPLKLPETVEPEPAQAEQPNTNRSNSVHIVE